MCLCGRSTWKMKAIDPSKSVAKALFFWMFWFRLARHVVGWDTWQYGISKKYANPALAGVFTPARGIGCTWYRARHWLSSSKKPGVSVLAKFCITVISRACALHCLVLNCAVRFQRHCTHTAHAQQRTYKTRTRNVAGTEPATTKASDPPSTHYAMPC